MILFFNEESETRARIYSVVQNVDTLTPEQISRGISVDTLPEDKSVAGQYAIYFLNPLNEQVWVEYETVPLTPEQEVVQLKENLSVMQAAIDDLIMGGMM